MYEKLKTIQDAINYEIDQHYVNSRGKKTTFSNFIIQNTKSLSFEFEEKEKVKFLLNLFYSYASQDINTRMDTIHKAQQVLREISEKNKKKITEAKKNNSLKQPISIISKDPRKTDVKYVKGVGPRISQALNRLGIFSVNDLFHYYPRTYINYKNKKAISDLRIDEEVTVCGWVKGFRAFNPPRRKDLTVFTIVINDSSGKISITRFIAGKLGRIIQEQYKKQYPVGAQVLCSGKVAYDKFSKSFCLNGAAIELMSSDKTDGKEQPLNAARIVPVYPLTEGISVEYLRKIVSNAFGVYGGMMEETLPREILVEEKFPSLKTALMQIHFPDNDELCNKAKNRIVFEEFFMMQLELAYRRYVIDKNRTGLCLKSTSSKLVEKLLSRLPFKLTNAQKKTYEELPASKKEDFDLETLKNPYSDTRILFGDNSVNVDVTNGSGATYENGANLTSADSNTTKELNFTGMTTLEDFSTRQFGIEGNTAGTFNAKNVYVEYYVYPANFGRQSLLRLGQKIVPLPRIKLAIKIPIY